METRENTTHSSPAPAPAPGAGAVSPAPASAESKPSSKLALTIAPKAAEAAKAQLSKRGTPESMIRLGVKGGGCSGFSYVIEFEDKPPREARDRVFECADVPGVRVVVDKKSLIYLAGTVLDWEKTLMNQGFKFRNPQEKSNCGCGHSFQV